MDAPPIPLRITREERVSLVRGVPWRPPTARLFRARNPWAFLGFVPILLIGGTAVYGWHDGWGGALGPSDRFPTAVMAMVFIMIGLSVVHGIVTGIAERRQLRRVLGREATFFIIFDAQGVQFGIHGYSAVWQAWGNCRLEARGRNLFVIALAARIPVNTRCFSAQELAQIRYWAGRHRNKPDLCPQCRYNLTASPGPACPECGAAVRIADVTGLTPPV